MREAAAVPEGPMKDVGTEKAMGNGYSSTRRDDGKTKQPNGTTTESNKRMKMSSEPNAGATKEGTGALSAPSTKVGETRQQHTQAERPLTLPDPSRPIVPQTQTQVPEGQSPPQQQQPPQNLQQQQDKSPKIVDTGPGKPPPPDKGNSNSNDDNNKQKQQQPQSTEAPLHPRLVRHEALLKRVQNRPPLLSIEELKQLSLRRANITLELSTPQEGKGKSKSSRSRNVRANHFHMPAPQPFHVPGLMPTRQIPPLPPLPTMYAARLPKPSPRVGIPPVRTQPIPTNPRQPTGPRTAAPQPTPATVPNPAFAMTQTLTQPSGTPTPAMVNPSTTRKTVQKRSNHRTKQANLSLEHLKNLSKKRSAKSKAIAKRIMLNFPAHSVEKKCLRAGIRKRTQSVLAAAEKSKQAAMAKATAQARAEAIISKTNTTATAVVVPGQTTTTAYANGPAVTPPAQTAQIQCDGIMTSTTTTAACTDPDKEPANRSPSNAHPGPLSIEDLKERSRLRAVEMQSLISSSTQCPANSSSSTPPVVPAAAGPMNSSAATISTGMRAPAVTSRITPALSTTAIAQSPPFPSSLPTPFTQSQTQTQPAPQQSPTVLSTTVPLPGNTKTHQKGAVSPQVVTQASAGSVQDLCKFPCPAKKMGPAHNRATAYFIIPPNSPHGMPLICSHALCRRGRLKFVYCKYCRQPVSRMKFDERHAHPEQVLLALSCGRHDSSSSSNTSNNSNPQHHR